MKDYIFTSESITEGHPDKICDSIADAILDEALRQDPYSNMAVEATIKDDFVLIYGEADTKAHIDYETIAKNVIRKIGYEEDYTVMVKVNKQSSEIHHAVNHENDEVGAGDQGIMFGYACNESDEYMPAPIYYAHKLARQLTKVRRENPLLRPDGKTQVSVEYENGRMKRIDTIVVSTQHAPQATQEEIRTLVMNEVILPCIEKEMMDEDTKFLINPSGSFVVGGSFGDSGTTGRKIVCDTYGGMGRIGGGCFSSKDPTKVDRSAAYMARYAAKNIVAAGLADKCEIQIAYAIGVARPLSVFVNTFGTGKAADDAIARAVCKVIDLRPAAIIEKLDLRRPIYKALAAYGHFGREELGVSWEKTDCAAELVAAVNE